MLSEFVSSLIPDHEEIGVKPEYDEIKTHESLKEHITKTFELLERTERRKDVLGKACGKNLVELLVYENNKHKHDGDTLTEKCDIIRSIGSAYAKKYNEKGSIFLNGFMAEAATAITLGDAGFTVLSSSEGEDIKGKIDMFVVDKNESNNPFIAAIQVKNSLDTDSLITYDIREDFKILENILKDQDIKNESTLINELAFTREQMLKYLSQNMERYKGRVVPLIIVVPGGDESNHPMYNMRTATPTDWMRTVLPDKLIEIVYKGEKL